MPIFMDRHDVSKEVTAETVAELHQKDLKIQHKFNCVGLTYWFDDKRKTAFCLVEAPNEAALKAMHDHAHGEIPNKIIEVDKAVVESFLGRIEDPEKSQKTELNIINDPAFRTLMVVGLKPVSLQENLEEKLGSIIAGEYNSINETLEQCKGRLVTQKEDYFQVSFDSVTNAVNCALEIQNKFEENCGRKFQSHLQLKIGLHAGVPVDEKNGFFEDTIKTAHTYYELVKGVVIMSSEVKDLYESENRKASILAKALVIPKDSDDKFLKELVCFTEKEWRNTSLSIHDFTRHLGYSKSGLYRRMIAMTGQSPNIFLKSYRLNRSLSLLNKREMNISQIAFETGFNSPAYFSKCFQETYGILPSQYQKSVCS